MQENGFNVRRFLQDEDNHFEMFKELCKKSYNSIGRLNKMIVIDHCLMCSPADGVFSEKLDEQAHQYLFVAESFGFVDKTKNLADFLFSLESLIKQEEYFGYTSLKDGSMLLRKDLKDHNYLQIPSHSCTFLMVSKKLYDLFQETTIDEIEKNRSEESPEIQSTGVHEVSKEFKNTVFLRVRNKIKIPTGVIYFLFFPKSKLLKIGFTTNLKTRISAYETHSAESFKIYKTINGTRDDEKDLHRRLSSFRVKKEFFKWCDEVKTIIESLD